MTHHIIDIPRVHDPRGNLSFIQHADAGPLPFEPKRVFWLYDVPAEASRGGHAHREGQEVIVALSGAFDVHLEDSEGRTTYRLDRPWRGLYVPQGVWREIDGFTSGAVCLVITSLPYSEADYIRDYQEFTTMLNAQCSMLPH